MTSPPGQTNPSNIASNSAATKVVSHALGQAEIPRHPQRIVVLDDRFLLDPLLALDIKPVGAAICAYCIPSETLNQFVADVSPVGHWEQPSLEKILSLKPDLIVGHVWQEQYYALLAAIAPTVMIDTDSEVDFKKNLKYLAEILDRSEQAKEILAEYNERIQKFRQQLGEKLKTKTVSVVHLYDLTVHVYGSDISVHSQVMNDAGIEFIPAYKNLKGYLQLSLEDLPNWDADILFVDILQKEDSEKLKSLSFLKQPIWSTLKAVQNDRVYAVSWSSTVVGPITANQLIDDLYKYFINTS
ncbi:ABC transporter substrate-binding protein [Thermocoleostomius sinensis]|uniref:Iron-siderophore ABC transporter substrate-binding protein n=1 Tax=Thermocoleostomius sinensis A174 TaxID=2016057 RepID=A0A9E8ZFT8_9CYAN|nr:iron-siderophore ABC transporter substrate-binding protein [Thermocoleostomius sinensis]WAL62619.1 iron-siderophore ABC transporter substrate-binding protein [Thermocoleostomius sinensis A174]